MKQYLVLFGMAIFLVTGCTKAEEEWMGDGNARGVVQAPLELKQYRFTSAEEVEQMSDEDMIYLIEQINFYETADFYEEGEFTTINLFDVELDKKNNENVCVDYFWLKDLEVELDVSKPIPEAEFDRLVEEDIQMQYYYANSKKPDEKTGDVVISEDTFLCGENDMYAEYSVRYTQRRTMYYDFVLVSKDINRAERKLYLKNYLVETNVGEWRAYLLGELSADYVKEQLDIFHNNGIPIIYREVIEEEDCYIYATYSIIYEYNKSGINNEVVLRYHTKRVDKDTHLITDEAPIEIRRVEIEGTEYVVIPAV